MNRFDGKVAIVTGAAGGIGRATAQRLADEGEVIDAPGNSIPGGVVTRVQPRPRNGPSGPRTNSPGVRSRNRGVT